jgi:type IV pilus assembly protein PilY1
MKYWVLRCFLAASLTTSWLAAAEDIDLFLGLPASEIDAPNVLFIVDNTANWNQPFAAEMAALREVFLSLPEGKINVGIMFFTETGGDNSNTSGGYVRAAVRPMTAANKLLYANLIDSFGNVADRSNSGKAGLAMAEAYLYYAGLSPEAGNNKVKTDYVGNQAGIQTVTTGSGKNRVTTTIRTASQDIYELPGNALNSRSSTTYNSPIAEDFCGKNYIIWVGNGAAQDSNSDSRRASDLLRGLGGDTTQISITPSGSAANMADEWARFMYNSGLGITTFTLDVNKVTTGQGPGWSALLRSMADQSAGKYYDVDDNFEDIKGALDDALSRILAVNSVFASVALPASANTQSTFLNQVYIGLFRPDENAAPRWLGNLKQYKLGFDDANVLRVVDQDNQPIVDAGTGFITECARSFWTPGTPDTYWSFLPQTSRRGECISVLNSKVSNYPDGPVVEKGGQAFVTRAASPASRVVKTCAASVAGCTTLTDFNNANISITAGILGAASAAERTALINWARGTDIDDENANGSTADMRPSAHGDIIHSQPVAIDFAADPANPQVVVFYGGNDGLLRAINGNRSSAHRGVNAGQELWAFMPPEFYPHIKRNRDNDPIIRFPASGPTAGAGGAPKPYGVDGPITAFDDGTNRYIYFGLRRAGRSVYAMNVSDVSAPELMWRRGCPNLEDDTGCSEDWENIGQTWSPLSVAKRNGGTAPVLLMGGGYDDCEDFDNGTANHQCSGSFKGNSVFIIDGESGALLKSFATDRPVVGQVTIVPVSDADQNIAFAYAADTGGNVYRISGSTGNSPIESTEPDDWTMTKIASLGCGPTATNTCVANRKFIFGPDVVRIINSDKFGVMLGSGDREKPLLDYAGAASVNNYFFGFVDRPTVGDWLDDPEAGDPARCNGDVICMNTLTSVTTAGPLVEGDVVAEKGWKLALAPTEQVVSGALTVASVVNFSTQIPSAPDAEACSANLGTATTYNVGFDSGQGSTVNIIGGGLVPTPVAGKVILDDGEIVPFCIGCGGEGSSIGGSQVTNSDTLIQHKSRVYWNIER